MWKLFFDYALLSRGLQDRVEVKSATSWANKKKEAIEFLRQDTQGCARFKLHQDSPKSDFIDDTTVCVAALRHSQHFAIISGRFPVVLGWTEYYEADDKVSCSRTQHSFFNESLASDKIGYMYKNDKTNNIIVNKGDSRWCLKMF